MLAIPGWYAEIKRETIAFIKHLIAAWGGQCTSRTLIGGGGNNTKTESDHLAHITFHKEHKTELSLKSDTLDDTDVLELPRGSEEHELSTLKAKNEAVIHLLTKEGSAPIYHEFTTILERTYPKLDVLQELHAM